jgi:hypothetical protein
VASVNDEDRIADDDADAGGRCCKDDDEFDSDVDEEEDVDDDDADELDDVAADDACPLLLLGLVGPAAGGCWLR